MPKRLQVFVTCTSSPDMQQKNLLCLAYGWAKILACLPVSPGLCALPEPQGESRNLHNTTDKGMCAWCGASCLTACVFLGISAAEKPKEG